jgi:hypothetical protein
MHRPTQTDVFGLLFAIGCTGGKSDPAPAAVEEAAPAPPTPTENPSRPDPKPNARIPTPGPIQNGKCPLAIVPGRALGPVQLGMSRAQLDQTGLPVTRVHHFGDEEMVRVGPYNATFCREHLVEAWIDDLRHAPDCVSTNGEPVPLDIEREKFIARFQDCEEAPPRIGGTFTECSNGGVRIGYGMGEFIQIRVGLEGLELDDDCRHVFDDGSPVEVPASELGPMLEQTVDLSALSPHWHPELAGRQPLRIVVGEHLADPSRPEFQFNKFGSPVVYVDAAEAAKSDAPQFELTDLRTTATTARIEFRYAVEGLVGSTTWRRQGDQWVMTDHEVAER